MESFLYFNYCVRYTPHRSQSHAAQFMNRNINLTIHRVNQIIINHIVAFFMILYHHFAFVSSQFDNRTLNHQIKNITTATTETSDSIRSITFITTNMASSLADGSFV